MKLIDTESSYTTWMGDCLRTGKPSGYVGVATGQPLESTQPSTLRATACRIDLLYDILYIRYIPDPSLDYKSGEYFFPSRSMCVRCNRLFKNICRERRKREKRYLSGGLISGETRAQWQMPMISHVDTHRTNGHACESLHDGVAAYTVGPPTINSLLPAAFIDIEI